MKVGLISFHSFSQPGGVKNHIFGLHNEFKRRGIESKIIVPRRSEEEDYGPDVILLGTSIPLTFSGSNSDFCVNFNPLAIEKILKSEEFDVLHFHNFGFPSIFQVLERSDALNILTLHADVKGSSFLKNFPTILRIFNSIVKWKVDGVIGVAPFVLDCLKKYKGQKIIIPNGIALKEFNPHLKKIEKFDDNKVNILFVGRIEERKGLIYLLQAYEILKKNYSNIRLIIVGDGKERRNYEAWTREHNLSDVHFEGQQSKENLARYYATANIYVSPAIFGESFGIVLLEAMASGAPLVAFSNIGYETLLKKTKAEKFLSKPKDYKGLADKIEILIKDESLRKEMSEWGIDEVKKYDWPNVADQIIDFYIQAKQKKKQTKDFQKIKEAIDYFFPGLYNEKKEK